MIHDDIFIFDNTVEEDLMKNLAAIVTEPGWKYAHIGNHFHKEYLELGSPNTTSKKEKNYPYSQEVLDNPIFGIGRQDQHWKFDLDPDDRVWNINGSNILWENIIQPKIKKQLKLDLELERAYVNGVTTDRYGFIHRDSDNSNAWTILYYGNLIWKPNWHGETVFYNDDVSDVTRIVYPRPGRWILFNARLFHVGMPVTSFFRGLRITYAFKTIEKKG